MLKLRYKDKALAFAKEWGWDGVLWAQSYDDYETYDPGLINDWSEIMPLTPPYDSVPRVIVADESGARWRNPEIGATWGDMRGKLLPRHDLNGRTIQNLEDFYD